jgi:hypothetical protein
LLTEYKLTLNPGLADTSLQDLRVAAQNIPVVVFHHPSLLEVGVYSFLLFNPVMFVISIDFLFNS